MSRHTKTAVFLIPAIALLSLAVSTSVLAEKDGQRASRAEQQSKENSDENSGGKRPRPRDEAARSSGEPIRNSGEYVQGSQEPAPETKPMRQREQLPVRGNGVAEMSREENDRESFRQRQQESRQQGSPIAERIAAGERIAMQRENDARNRMIRDNQNERQDSRPGFQGNDRDDNRSRDRDDRDNRNNNQERLIGNKLPRPEQQREQRQWQEQQQRQANDYRRHYDNQHSNAQRFTQRLREQNRNEQYRSQQRYYDRLNNQRHHFDRHRNDYYRGSYIYSPIIYRYNRGGHYYYANRYQADLMREAINNGYEEGHHAGRADRMDRWGYNFREAYAYQDANYGYYGYYVDRGTYNYYFREGFRRGYDDGYYSRYRYGRQYNNRYSLNDSVFRLILNFSDWRH